MQVVHGENDRVANDPLVEYPPLCVIYPAHDLIPFPGRDNVVGQDHVRLFLRPFLPYLIDERLRLLPIIHVERVELPPFGRQRHVCLPGKFLHLSRGCDHSHDILGILGLAYLYAGIAVIYINHLFRCDQVRLRHLIQIDSVRPYARHIGQEIVRMLQAVGIGHVKRIEKTSLGRHADGRLLAETFPVGLYAQDIRHALRVIDGHEVRNGLVILHGRGEYKMYRLGIIHCDRQAFHRADLRPGRGNGQRQDKRTNSFHFRYSL